MFSTEQNLNSRIKNSISDTLKIRFYMYTSSKHITCRDIT